LQREGKNAAILNDDAPIATASALIDVRPEAQPASRADSAWRAPSTHRNAQLAAAFFAASRADLVKMTDCRPATGDRE